MSTITSLLCNNNNNNNLLIYIALLNNYDQERITSEYLTNNIHARVKALRDGTRREGASFCSCFCFVCFFLSWVAFVLDFLSDFV